MNFLNILYGDFYDLRIVYVKELDFFILNKDLKIYVLACDYKQYDYTPIIEYNSDVSYGISHYSTIDMETLKNTNVEYVSDLFEMTHENLHIQDILNGLLEKGIIRL